MKRLHSFIIQSLILFFWALHIFPQELSVSARVDSQRIGEQDQLQLTVEISGSEAGSVKAISLPQMKNLRVVAGPSVSTRFQWINGVSSSSKSFTYILVPDGKGEAEVPSITIPYGGRSFRTEPLKIEVVAGSQKRREMPQRPAWPDITGEEQIKRGAEPDLFVRAVLDKSRLYQGEQATLSYRVYTTVPIIDINLEEMPSFEGFWVEDLKVDPEATKRIVEVNGKRYHEYTIMKKALFSSVSGKKTIKPLTFAISVRSRSDDFFESIFWDRPIRLFKSTESVTIDVSPLPEKGRPDSFGGAVGDFRMKVEADRRECSVSDAVGIKVMVEGEGNLKGVSPPIVAEAPDFKIYEPKVTDEVRFQGDRMQSRKIWDYIVIPLAPGDHTLPEFNFSFFKPSGNDYEKLKSQAAPLSVKKGVVGAPSVAIVQKGDITPLRRDINFIKPLKGEIVDAGAGIHRSWWYYFLLILPLVLIPACVALSLRKEKVRLDIRMTRIKKAYRSASKGLKRARRLIGGGNMDLALQEISRSMVGYVADKFNQSSSGLTYEMIEELLDSRRVDNEKIRRFITTLEKCDYSRFASGMSSSDQAGNLISDAEASLAELDKAL
ncbi:MAG: BatD family protein [Acidobacteriota bacterium]